MNTIVVTSTKQNIKFGYEGEDNVTKIIFPYDESWLEYGEGNFEVRILRCGDEVAYTATEVVDDRQAMTLTMTVTDIELSVRGRGEMQLCYVCPDSIKKSPIYQYTVNRSIDYKYAVDPPDGSIIASVEKSLSEIKNTTNRLSNSVISIENSINDVNSQIDNINNKISEFDEEIDSIGEVDTRVDNLETSIGSINGRINTAEGNINENTESISDLNESVTELENRKVTDLETSGGKSDSGKYLTVGTDGKIKATSLTIPPTITVDDSLSTASKNPVQNKVIKTELNNINSNIETCNTEISKLNGSLDTLGEDLTYVTDKIQHVTPSDWHNTEADTVGFTLNADGTTTENENRFYTDFIPVKVGDIVRHYARNNHNFVYRNAVTYYDKNKNIMASAGSNSTANNAFTVPDGVAYVRITFATNLQEKVIITVNLVPTDWSIQYFAPYYTLTHDMVTEESETAIENAKNLKSVTVKGTNLVSDDNTFVGQCYWGSNNNIVVDETATTYRYIVVPLKKNTRYIVNASCRFYIFTDNNDNRISSGNTNLGSLFFDSGEATRLYYTVAKNNYDIGMIIAEGYSGTLANVSKPTFLNGLNQLMFDSWFAVALPPRTIRFTVGISEKLYYYNILSLAKNMVDISGLGSKDAEGITVTPVSQTIGNNAYGYTVYDDNLSVVANAPRGGQNRLTIRTDNVQDCSALIIGDSIIARNSGAIGQTMLDAFTQRGKTLTLLGTLGTGDSKHEGRPGWTITDYFSDKTYNGVVNPFYNPTSETFDFSYYMSNAGYSAVDYICIHLGGNDLFSTPFSGARTKIAQTEELLCNMIDNILAWNPDQKIIIQLAPTTSPKWDVMNAVGANPVLVRAVFNTFNAEMFLILTRYSDSNVRVSNDYMIVDPNNELADNIHPNNTGLAKIGMELVSQINCWQNE